MIKVSLKKDREIREYDNIFDDYLIAWCECRGEIDEQFTASFQSDISHFEIRFDKFDCRINSILIFQMKKYYKDSLNIKNIIKNSRVYVQKHEEERYRVCDLAARIHFGPDFIEVLVDGPHSNVRALSYGNFYLILNDDVIVGFRIVNLSEEEIKKSKDTYMFYCGDPVE